MKCVEKNINNYIIQPSNDKLNDAFYLNIKEK